MCKNPKKFGKKAVLVALAAVLGAAVLATGVLAEDVKPSYDRAYFDADTEYLDWWYETEKIIEADKYSLLYARKRDDAKDFYKWSKKLEYDAKTAMGESKQFGDDYVSPKLQLAINKDRLRYEELERAGYHGAGSVEYDSTGYFEECIKNMKMASQYNKESEKIREDWITTIEKDAKILEKEFEKSQDSSRITTQTEKSASETTKKPSSRSGHVADTICYDEFGRIISCETTYGELKAFKNNKDVTDVAFREQVYLYECIGEPPFVVDKSPPTSVYSGFPTLVINEHSYVIMRYTGPYDTYGEVCDNLEIRVDSQYVQRGDFYDGPYFTEENKIDCQRKSTTKRKSDPEPVPGFEGLAALGAGALAYLGRKFRKKK